MSDIVKARKTHLCCRCGGLIVKGARHATWTYFDTDAPVRCHSHVLCERTWMPPEWMPHDPGWPDHRIGEDDDGLIDDLHGIEDWRELLRYYGPPSWQEMWPGVSRSRVAGGSPCAATPYNTTTAQTPNSHSRQSNEDRR